MEEIGLKILDKNLSVIVFETIYISPCSVDPWRIFWIPKLVDRISQIVVESWKNEKMEIIASVSDLGMPLAVNIALEANNRGLFQGKLCFLAPLRKPHQHWIYPHIETKDLKDKNIFLCDDVINAGAHALCAIERLQEIGAKITQFVVLFDNIAEPNRDSFSKIKNLGVEISAISGIERRCDYE